MYSRLFNGHEVCIVKGDITKENIDAIVNPANEFLRHGGGVARAISEAGGTGIQKDSDEYIEMHGTLNVGSSCILPGGNLIAKYVIHTVGPVWGSADEDSKLKSAIVSSLKLCEENNIYSVSIPAISSGIFGFPKDRCAKIFRETLEDYFEENTDSKITLVRLCNIDRHTYDIFLAEFEGR